MVYRYIADTLVHYLDQLSVDISTGGSPMIGQHVSHITIDSRLLPSRYIDQQSIEVSTPPIRHKDPKFFLSNGETFSSHSKSAISLVDQKSSVPDSVRYLQRCFVCLQKISVSSVHTIYISKCKVPRSGVKISFLYNTMYVKSTYILNLKFAL